MNIVSRVQTAWLAFFCFGLQPGVGSDLPAVTALARRINGDQHIANKVRWTGGHYQVHGNVLLETGGELVLEDATLELMNTYARQFNICWRGGRLRTTRATLG
ncbi:MAG: hypothetical protein N2689_10265, partial [Verrucomicrobiae bacterium]|nr:hypothetical protein [Verrucomicrobiae bacterium]